LEINGQLLYKYISRGRLAQAGLAQKPFGNVVYRVRRFYCRPLTIANRCGKCEDCKARLIAAVEGIHEAREPEAMLVYQLRKLVADQVEAEHHAVVRTKDAFGTRDNTSVWDALMAEVA
jgi:hypothetical protein